MTLGRPGPLVQAGGSKGTVWSGDAWRTRARSRISEEVDAAASKALVQFGAHR